MNNYKYLLFFIVFSQALSTESYANNYCDRIAAADASLVDELGDRYMAVVAECMQKMNQGYVPKKLRDESQSYSSGSNSSGSSYYDTRSKKSNPNQGGTSGKFYNPQNSTGQMCISAQSLGPRKSTSNTYCHPDYINTPGRCFDKQHGVRFSNSCNREVTVMYSCGSRQDYPTQISSGKSREAWVGEIQYGCQGQYSFNSHMYR